MLGGGISGPSRLQSLPAVQQISEPAGVQAFVEGYMLLSVPVSRSLIVTVLLLSGSDPMPN